MTAPLLALAAVTVLAAGAAPDAGVSVLPPDPDDPLTQLYLKRLDFRHGEPTVPVRLMEGAREVQFRGLGRFRMRVHGAVPKTVEAPAEQTFRVRLLESRPAKLRVRVQLGEFRFHDRAGWMAERARLEALGLPVKLHTLGAISGIAGKVLDNRRQLLLLDEALTAKEAVARQSALKKKHGLETSLFETLEEPPHGKMALIDAAGAVLAEADALISAEAFDDKGFAVSRVEYGVGYDFHGFEDRTFRGALQLTLDRNGTIAVVNQVALEDLLAGLVPSEIFARSHPEALKAQAVTARGEVLAKIGLKHLADPYLLCSEQHCAVYKGRGGEAASTNAAVVATRGEAIFSPEGRLVDSVYSAVCGGHSESNENVWGGPPDPTLRGKPDTLGANDGASPADLAAFLASPAPAACRVASFAQASKFRWERRLTAHEVDSRTEGFGVGPIQAISVTERGVSGRAKAITLSGRDGATQVRGELNIRRLFGMLNSAMFLVETIHGADGAPAEWVFRGGGWGHGVGMCQMGAVGRAEAGQNYRAILRHYFNGAEAATIY